MPTTHASSASDWKGAVRRSDVTRNRNGRAKIPCVSVSTSLEMSNQWLEYESGVGKFTHSVA